MEILKLFLENSYNDEGSSSAQDVCYAFTWHSSRGKRGASELRSLPVQDRLSSRFPSTCGMSAMATDSVGPTKTDVNNSVLGIPWEWHQIVPKDFNTNPPTTEVQMKCWLSEVEGSTSHWKGYESLHEQVASFPQVEVMG